MKKNHEEATMSIKHDIHQKSTISIWRFDYATKLFLCSHVEMGPLHTIVDETLTIDQWLHLIHPDDQEKSSIFLDHILTEKKPYNDYYRIIVNKKIIYVHIASRIDYMNGKASGLLGTMEDITYDVILSFQDSNLLKSYEQTIDRLSQNLITYEQKLNDTTSSANRFISTLSHEIRTPMNAMIGFLELLKQTSLNNEQVTYLERISSASDHLLSIVNDILDLTKIESGKMKVERYAFNLIDLIEDVKKLMLEQIQKKRLYMDIEYIDCPLKLKGDRLRLRQVLINLLSNAIKFTDMGGISVIVNSKKRLEDEIDIEITIKDTGIGMTREQQSRLFYEFEQADQKTSRIYGGTGLGLPISKKLVELMGGIIRCDSALNEGTTFTITLPLQIEDVDSDEKPNYFLSSTKKGACILVAEDHVLSQKLTERMLLNMGMHVELASDGKKALSLLEQKSFDLVLMDVEMPVLNGIDATALIRKFNMHTPIIALTGHIYPDEHAKILLSGMNDIMLKPLTHQSLFMMLAKWLPEEE